MAHIQYMPGDPRLVDQLVYELKSKGIFDQFRKDCIADVDTRPAYQNLRQRVENSVATFLSRQTWQPDLNKNQLREKLRKHILDGNYLEQGLERIVDQVVNPKVASVFIPKVEDLVYNYLGIVRKKSISADTSNGKIEDLLPNDLEAVSPGSVKSNDDKNESMDIDETQEEKIMEVEEEKSKSDEKDDNVNVEIIEYNKYGKPEDIQLPNNGPNEEIDKINIPLPSEEIKPENIPSPDTSPPKVELEKIELPKEPIISTDIPLPEDINKEDKDQFFKPVNSDEDDSSSDSSLRRNMSPLTPIRNFNNENSYDAQQGFENDLVENKVEDNKEPSSFRFTIEAKSSENSSDALKSDKKETEVNLSYQFSTQVNINNFNTPLYEDSSNSNNLQIDYESDANSKANIENKIVENDQNSEDSKKEKKPEEKKSSSHKSSHRSRDSHKHSSKDKRSESKHSSSRDSSRYDKSKSSKDDSKSKPNDKDKSKDKNEKKNSRDSSRHRSSHKSSHKDSKSHRSSSSSGKHSSKHSDEKKSSSQKEKHLDKNSSEKSKDSKSNSHRSDKDKKSSSSSSSTKSDKNSKSKPVDKDKKNKKETDDHYSLSGRGNPNRRSTDRDSNDGSSSSKGSHNPSTSKSSNSKKDSKSSSKSESTSTSGESTSPSDKENIVREHRSKSKKTIQHKPIVRIDSHLEMPVVSPPRLPFVPDVTIKKPKIAANFEEAKRLMKMRKFLDEEQKRMNQEAALLLEFQANVRPSLSQVYSSIPGPELEFACVTTVGHPQEIVVQSNDNITDILAEDNIQEAHYTNNELLTVLNDARDNEEGLTGLQNNSHNKITYNTNTDLNHDIEKRSPSSAKSEKGITFNKNNVESAKNECLTNVVAIKNLHENNKQKELLVTSENNINEQHTNHIGIEEQLKLFEVSKEDEKSSIPVDTEKVTEQDHRNRSDLFEVTIITEELSESEEISADEHVNSQTKMIINNDIINTTNQNVEQSPNEGENELRYFGEHEKYNAELERARFSNFFKEYNEKSGLSNKIYLINCNTYEKNIFREISKDFGDYEVVNYYKNGHIKLPKSKNVIKNLNISTEISLPIETEYENVNDSEIIQSHNVFSPDKSDCSFELSSDYDARLEEMVNKTSRQEIMEIILGNVVDSPSKMPRIDYLTDSNIDSEYEYNLKRKMADVETTVNNNRHVLTPNKIRKLSTDQITSTTTENEEIPSGRSQNITRSKYLGKARRVGLPRPRKSILPNSPSSDKSVENYEQNTPSSPQPPNGKIKRSKVQRYDTSDLYKPKLHFLSRRNHVT